MDELTEAARAVHAADDTALWPWDVTTDDMKDTYRAMAIAARDAWDRAEPAPEFPRPSGDVTVLGPECFTNGDVICWRGENFYRAQPADPPRVGRARHGPHGPVAAIGAPDR